MLIIITSKSIFEKQIQYTKKMKPLHQPKIDLLTSQRTLFQTLFKKQDNTWKAIVFDQDNHNIISSLLKVKDFRQNNITLYFNINQHRQQLHGVTVIYLIKPNMENVQLIVSDFQHDLYSSVVVHFSSEPPAHLVSSLAKSLSKIKSSVSKVQKIQFSNIGFQCIDRQMCILSEHVELVNLLSVLKNQPLFIYGPSDEQKVNLFKQKITQSAFWFQKNDQEKNLLKQSKNYTKVLIFNRENDYFPVFSHGITYASLMQDVWKFNKTGTKIMDKKEQIDLNDQIWLQRKNLLTSEMELQSQLSKIKSKLMGLNNKMQQFSELTEKQKKIQWHLDSAAQIITKAKQRRLNEFHAVQEDFYIKKMLSGQNKQQFISLLATAPNIGDKTRLMLTYLTSVENYDQNQVQELENIFPGIKKNNFYNEIKAKRFKNESQQSPNSKYLKKFAKGIWKNLVNQQKKYLVVKYLQKTRDLSQRNLKQLGLRVTSLNELPQNPKIQHSVVYCIGGVCFNEYANLTESHPNIIYAGDKFINYRQFI